MDVLQYLATYRILKTISKRGEAYTEQITQNSETSLIWHLFCVRLMSLVDSQDNLIQEISKG